MKNYKMKVYLVAGGYMIMDLKMNPESFRWFYAIGEGTYFYDLEIIEA